MSDYFVWALSYIKDIFGACFGIVHRIIPIECWSIIFGAFAFTAFCRLVLAPVVRPSTNVSFRRDDNNARKVRENIKPRQKIRRNK